MSDTPIDLKFFAAFNAFLKEGHRYNLSVKGAGFEPATAGATDRVYQLRHPFKSAVPCTPAEEESPARRGRQTC